MSRQYIGQDPIELFKHLADQQAKRQMFSCEGLITSVDEKTYMAKVMLQPWGIETGWLPIGTLAAGPNWGIFHLPPDDTEVTVDFIGGSIDNGRIRCCYTNDTDVPTAGVKQGEILIQHASGSLLHFDTDGNVNLVTAKDLTATIQGDVVLSALGDVTAIVQGDTTIGAQGDLTAAVQGDATIGAQGGVGLTSAASVSIRGAGSVRVEGGAVSLGPSTTIDGKVFLAHTHAGVEPGGGTSGPVI